MSLAQHVSDGGNTLEPVWTEIEHAAIAELIDLGTSYAVPSLQALLGKQVRTSCNTRLICSRRDAAHLLQADIETPVIAVSRRFAGSYCGVLTIILPERARHVITCPTAGEDDVSEPVLITLTRFADVLLTQCLAEMETTLGLGLQPDKVLLDQGFPYDVVVPSGAGLEDQLFVFSLEVRVANRSATATLIAGVDRASTDALKRYLHEFLDIDGGPDQTH